MSWLKSLRTLVNLKDPASRERLLKEAAEAQHDKLFAHFAHALREPLAVCMGELELLISEPHSEPCRDGLISILRSVRQEAAVITSLFDQYENPPVAPVSGDAPKPRVLLVDDYEATRWVLTRLLWRQGYAVVAVGTVRDALAMAHKGDFLISDIELPDGSGYDLIRALSANGIRGVAISGFGSDADRQASLAAGFAEHFVKPLDLKTIVGAISHYSLN